MAIEVALETNGQGSEDSGQRFDNRQLRRGLAILIAFVIFRALVWGPLWTQPTPDQPVQFGLLLAGTILVGSILLVYLGFSRWVDVDVLAWWVDRAHLGRDILWGLLGFGLALLVTLGLSLSLQSFIGPPPGTPPTKMAPSLQDTLLLLVFGFGVAAFQEETIFRGFLQPALGERIGGRAAILVQAAVFSLAHVGYYPLTAWYWFAIAFAGGLVYGWLRSRRERLITPGLAHGLVG